MPVLVLVSARCTNPKCPEEGFAQQVPATIERDVIYLRDEDDGECSHCEEPCEISRS
jgi:hypothetical protein